MSTASGAKPLLISLLIKNTPTKKTQVIISLEFEGLSVCFSQKAQQ